MTSRSDRCVPRSAAIPFAWVDPFGRRLAPSHFAAGVRPNRGAGLFRAEDSAVSSFPLDVVEHQDRYVLTAELPGTPREAIAIEADAGVLAIRVRRPERTTESDSVVRVAERARGEAVRTIGFREEVDFDRAVARLDLGVLTLELPKRRRPTGRSIPIDGVTTDGGSPPSPENGGL
jgi:HSP20 family protein